MRNISTGGAAVDLDAPTTLPQSFKLSISCDNFVRTCRPVWRSDKRVGLAFVQ
ncbi:PilZ domain-containing protein [Bradyrhizobium zhanjiangense]|uniref:PilZ domain-containing protein n=1 Tax=Bradyrhizobium zhanjiangense TaxID=1325107 RepID=UPI001FDFDACC|nr:PilZ domain-containing protein [Bradyrhizobium zhanjiangense]